MNELLLSFGINIASSAVYDFLKTTLLNPVSKTELIGKLSSQLDISNAKIVAEKIIDFAAQNGDITINGTSVYATDSITMQSASSTKFNFGNNSTSTTSTTQIIAGEGTSIVGQGGAKIVQNSDGSISFFS